MEKKKNGLGELKPLAIYSENTLKRDEGMSAQISSGLFFATHTKQPPLDTHCSEDSASLRGFYLLDAYSF